jgi:hypothetical protein
LVVVVVVQDQLLKAQVVTQQVEQLLQQVATQQRTLVRVVVARRYLQRQAVMVRLVLSI